MTDKYLLKFQLELEHSQRLIPGTLQLIKNGSVQNVYRASSSLPGKQVDGSWKYRGGLIPPTEGNYLPRPGELYAVALLPVTVNLPGVSDGGKCHFYPISPSQVNVDGTARGDWGIHFDGNVPGSLGCIVCETMLGWKAFERDIAKIRGLGVDSIDLDVIYS